MSETKRKCRTDIPRNIGNLPMRLRKKYAGQIGIEENDPISANDVCDQRTDESFPETSTTTDNERLIKTYGLTNGNSIINNLHHPDKDVTLRRLDLLQRKTANAFVDPSTSAISLKKTDTSSCKENLRKEVTIPGILRIKSNSNSDKVSTFDKKPTTIRVDNLAVISFTEPIWFKDIYEKDISYAKELPQLHSELNRIIKSKSFLNEWDTFNEYRTRMKITFTQLLSNKMKFCCEQNVELYFWKIIYYNVIEYFKKLLNIQSEYINDQVLEIINDGLLFYNNLLITITQKYLIKDNETEDDDRFFKYESIAKVSTQKILINLGDLCRYRDKFQKSIDFNEAKNYYEKAQAMIPSNGIPYNQLAILAIYSRNKFDAIYFHMRSLMSSNPIHSARESLKVLFDDNRKKYEEINCVNEGLHQSSAKMLANVKKTSIRREIWVNANGDKQYDRNSSEKNEDHNDNYLDSLGSEEILKKFISTYLYLIGKLFSGVGFENFNSAYQQLLKIFNAVIHRDQLIISRNSLLKILALNIFVIEHNKVAESRQEIYNRALDFATGLLDMIVHRTNNILLKLRNPNGTKCTDILPKDVHILLQYIKIWCDWLTLNKDVWQLIEVSHNKSWATLISHGHILSEELQLKYTKFNDLYSVKLGEDDFLSGFLPINELCYIAIPIDIDIENELVQSKLRIERIISFGEAFLMERIESQNVGPSSYDIETIEFFEEMNDQAIENEDNDEIDSCTDDDDCTFDELNSLQTNTDERLVLSRLKLELEKKLRIKKMYNEQFEKIMQDVESNLYIEVRPKYLVPDTNCFIDSLEELQTIAQKQNPYYLIVPLIVVKELDGLSKGVKVGSGSTSQTLNKRIRHFDEVSSLAKKSLEFIKTCSHVKCATTKGSILNSSLFGLEEEEQLSNDDKILATALALGRTNNHLRTEDGKSFLQTELVLLTTDRNLRVKALSRNLIVSELKEFLNWAK